jgi:transcriptional regulator with XRE-family HTH domain
MYFYYICKKLFTKKMQHSKNLNFHLSLLDMNLDKSKIVEFLKDQRKLKKMNQAELAKKTDLFQQKISQLENLTLDFSIDELNSWCNALDLSTMQVILYTHPMHPLSQDLKILEEQKQKELEKNEILEKLKDLLEYVKKL